jgi:phospholipase/carboxylesterase
MAGFFDLDGPRFGPAAGGTAQQLVILLHGLGADGQDLIGLAPHWAQVLPNAAFASPNAPFPCDMAPYGYQWFSVQDRSPEAMLSGVRMAASPLDAFIDAEMERTGVDESRTALVGFSKGTMMSLFVGPRRERPLAGIVGF